MRGGGRGKQQAEEAAPAVEEAAAAPESTEAPAEEGESA